MADRLEDLRDRVAVQDEHSHVDAETRRRIGRLILERDPATTEEAARALVEGLTPEELAALGADWLDAQEAI
jgi:hypothetical protein